MRRLAVGVRVGLAHEALPQQRDAKFFHDDRKSPVASYQSPVGTEISTGYWLLATGTVVLYRFTLPPFRVPAHRLALLDRFQCEQARERRVIADLHVRRSASAAT